MLRRITAMLVSVVMIVSSFAPTVYALENAESLVDEQTTEQIVNVEETENDTVSVTEEQETVESFVTEDSEITETAEVTHEHEYETVVTAPTCTEQGYTTYTCECGESYVDDYVIASAHNYENGICNVCGSTTSPYLQQLPDDITGCSNLYNILTPTKGYYTATKYDTGNGDVLSVVIPVKTGDRIAASSFGSVSENMGSVNGIRVTYLLEDEIVTSLSAGDVYNGYTNNGYITVPEGVDAVCIPWWAPSDSNWLTLSQISKNFASHSPKTVSAQAQTCTENGYTAGEICEICNASLGSREEIPATGHDYSENTCTICGALNIFAILEGKYISILGDSISTFNGYSNDATVNTTIGENGPRYDAGTADTKPGSYCLLESVDDTWWMHFANHSGMKLLVNNSWAGSQVFGGQTSDGRVIPAAYLERCINLHDNTIENNLDNTFINPDVIFVYLGINDYNFNRSNVGDDAVDYAALINSDGTYVTPVTFGEAYGILLHKMQQAYSDAQIFAMTLLPENLYSVDMTAWEQHNAYIRAAAEYYDISVVDLAEKCAITWDNYSGYMIDKIHPTTAGMELISDCIEAELVAYYTANPPHNHSYEFTITAPTCTEQGYTTYTCTCGDSYVDNYTEITEHIFTNLTCDVCGYEQEIVYPTYDEAILAARQQMVNREKTVSVQFVSETDMGSNYAYDFFDAVTAHTGNPKEGDYLTHNMSGKTISNAAVTSADGGYLYSFDININWWTTAQQEAEVDAAVDTLLAELNLWDKEDYYKIRGVYDYICEYIEYDHEHVGDSSYTIKQTAYAALIKKICVCEGYATLFYRLMLELGVDSRVITGTAGDENHAWNIVKLNNGYYNMDSTWDAGITVYYRYFLCTPYDFRDHTRRSQYDTAEFNAQYPMATMPFVLNVAASGTTGNLTWVLDGDTGELKISGTGNMPNYGNLGAPWYDYHENITSIVLIEGITSVGDYSFVRCKNVTSVTLPSTLKRIGKYGFDNCRALASINLPDGLTNIDTNAFSECIALREIVIPGSVRTFGSGIFSNSYNLYKVTFAEGMTHIPDSMLYNSDGLYYVNFPSTITSIGDTAFRDCDKLQNVTIPAGLNSLGYGVFSDCTSLKNIYVEDGNTVYKDVDGVLFTLDGKTLVTFPAGRWGTYTIPDGVVRIGDAAFCRAKSMTDIVIPDSVQYIGEYAFTWCAKLTNVTIGKNVVSIGDTAYGFCTGLKTVTFLNPNTTLDWHVFTDCTALTSITLPSNLKKLDTGLLSDCDKLQNVNIPSTVTVIGDSTFCCNDGITQMILPKGVYSIGYCAFDRAKSLKEITIPGNISKIDWGAFSDCTALKFIRFGGTLSGVYTVERNKAFGGCTNLTAVYFDNASAANGVTYQNAYGGLVYYAKSIAVPATMTAPSYITSKYSRVSSITFDGVAYKLYSNHSCSFKSYWVVADNHTAVTSYRCSTCDARKDITTYTHSYNSVIKAPTCTERGYTTYNCKVCDYSYVSNYVNSLGHSYSIYSSKDESCTEDGYVTYCCTRCDDTYTDTISATGHTEVTDAAVAAACETTGLTEGRHCSVCSTVIKAQETVPALGHDWGKGVVTTAPTCTEKGVKTFDCTRCDETKTEEVAATGHSYESSTTKPTCTEAGYTTYTCKTCGHTYKEDGEAAKGHSYTSKVTEPTCTDKGYTIFTCSACGDSYKDDETSATGHSYTNKVTVQPTCTLAGIRTYTCSVCDDSYTEAIAATGHTEAVDAAVAPDCTNTGLTEGKHCSVCNTVIVAQTVVDALGHTEETIPATDATCESTGLTTGVKCSVCGEILVKQAIVSAKGHKYEKEVTAAPTCTAAGIATHTCSVCDDSYTEEEPALGHDLVYDAVQDATCTEPGESAGSHCTRCDYTTGHSDIPALGHDWGEGVVTTAPACTEKGVKTFDCTRCDETKTEEVAATGHIEVIDEAVVPTCTETGFTEGSHCIICSTVLVAQTVLTATGHNYTGKITAATCTAGGYTTYTCNNCDDSYKADETAATGHSYTSKVTAQPTCTAEGVETFTCTAGDHTYTESVAALGHDLEDVAKVDATCTQDGKEAGKDCTRCDYTEGFAVIPAIGHSWDEGVVTTAPTCTDAGVKTYACTACDDTETEVVAALGHTEIIDEAVAPTCTKTGLTEGKHCEVCEEVLVVQEVVEASGHSFTEYVLNGDGTKTAKCDNCDETGTVNDEIHGGTFGENITWFIDSTGTLYIKGTGAMEDTEADIPWNEHKETIVKTVIDEEITTIADKAFSDCTALSAVVIPEKVTSIGAGAFSNCQSLTAINIPVSVTAIGENAFGGCDSLENITYAGTIDQWNNIHTDDSFGGLGDKEIVTMSSFETAENADGTVTITGVNVTLRGEFTVPSEIDGRTVTAIGENAFEDCGEITELVIPHTVTYIGVGAFSGCTSLKNVIIPDSVTAIGENAFEANEETVFVVSKGSAAHIWLTSNGFANLDVKVALEEIKLPESITLTYGEVKELTAEILPADTTDAVDLVWTVSDETIAAIDAEGVITAVSLGVTEVKVTDLNSGKSATTVVTVKLPAGENIVMAPDAEIEAIGLQEGESRHLTVSSETAGEISAEKITFTSSAPEIVSVDENGVITSLYTGEDSRKVTITAEIESDSSKKVTFTVRAIAKQINLMKIYAEIDETVSAEYREQIKIVYPYIDNTPVVVIPKELVANGILPINLKAVSVDAEGNETAANVRWASDAAAVASVLAVKVAKGQPASEVWGLAKATVKKNAKANGLAVITATANDVKKVTATVEVDVRDYTPRLENNTVTLNTNLKDGTQVKLYTAYEAFLKDYPSQTAMMLMEGEEVVDVVLEGKDSENFWAEYDSESGMVTFNSYDVIAKNGAYKLTLKVFTERGETSQAFTLKVLNKLPAVTLKQLASFNRFYKDSEAEVTVTVKNETVTNIELVETATFAATQYNAENGSFTLVYADTNNPLNGYDAKGRPDVAAKVNVYFEGYRTPVVKVLAIKHNETKPKLSLNRNSTVYTYLNSNNDPVQIIETVGKDKTALDFGEESKYKVELTAASDGYAELTPYGTDILLTTKLGENNKFANNTTSHKANLEVSHENWLKAMVFVHTITVNTTKPTVKAKATALTISSLFNSEAVTDLTSSVANCPEPVEYRIVAVKPDENTAKISVTGSGWKLKAAFADMTKLPANGSYEFSVVPVVKNSAGENTDLAAFKVKVTVNNSVPTIKPAQSTVNIKGESYEGMVETALIVNPTDCPEIRYEVAAATASQKANTDKLVVTAEGRTVKVGFADANDLPANGSYKYTINGYITDIAGNEIALASTAITVKVSTAAPKVTLEKAAVTLNKDVAEDASLGIKSVTDGYEVVDMAFTTTNVKTEGRLEVSYDDTTETITAKVTDASLANGVYTYNGVITVKVASDDVTTTQELKTTVKVTVKSGVVSLKTSAKGSIDLANRGNGITYTVTGLNNYNYAAAMIDENTFALTGNDKDKFDIIYTGLDAKGQHTVMVTAKADAQLNRGAKYSYNISAKVEGVTEAVSLVKAVTVVTRQTNLKFKVTGSTTIYQSYTKGYNSFTIEATIPTGAEIKAVKIAEGKATTVPDKALVYTITENEEDGSWQVNYWIDKASAVKINRVYKLTFEITPEGNGENVKPQTFTVNLKVKR